MHTYTHLLERNKIYQSMSRKGTCLDNAVIEKFFGIMKQEMYHGVKYTSYAQLKGAIDKYIKYYNEIRIKERLEWMSPKEYRLNSLAA